MYTTKLVLRGSEQWAHKKGYYTVHVMDSEPAGAAD